MSDAIARRNRRCVAGIIAMGAVGVAAVDVMGKHPAPAVHTVVKKTPPVVHTIIRTHTVVRTVVRHAGPFISGGQIVALVIGVTLIIALSVVVIRVNRVWGP